MNKIENDNLIKIIVDAQNGVEGAFEELYKETINFSYGIALTLLKNEEDIEDALQNSYMYVAGSLSELKRPESFESWLGVIVRHECQKYLAKNAKRSFVISSLISSKEIEMPEDEFTESELIERRETSELVKKIIDKLPEDKRACIVLYYIEQHTLPEISEILGIPEGTVKSRLYSARKTLEKEFKKLQKKDDSLFGISVIPLIIAFFTYQAKNVVVPAAIEKAVIGAVAAGGAAAGTTVAAASATAAGSTASGTAVTAAAGATTAGTSAAAGTATAAVATKVAAIAVAGAVATGGTVATVNVVKEHREKETTTIVTEITTEEYATVAMYFTEESTTAPEESTTAASTQTEKSTAHQTTTTVPTRTTQTETQISTTEKKTRPSTTRRDYSLDNTTKPVTETKPVTTATTLPTTAVTTTAKPTTTEPETEEITTGLSDVYGVSGGVLGEYRGSGSDVSVPSEVGSETVTAIGTGAFSGNTAMRSVSVPSTVTKIGQEAFSDCTNLRSVSLPSSLESIGIGAFYGCTSLESIAIPSGVKSIGDDAFADCSSLSTVTIPSSVTSIGDYAFDGCENLIIKCEEGSAAHDYAVENSIEFELI